MFLIINLKKISLNLEFKKKGIHANRNHENRSQTLDPIIYSLSNNLDSFDQRPPSYNHNFALDDPNSNQISLAPPKYEELNMNDLKS